MTDAPKVPEALVEAVLNIVERINPGRDLHIITIVAESGKKAPPVMVSSIAPEQIPEILQWFIDHHSTKTLTKDGRLLQ